MLSTNIKLSSSASPPRCLSPQNLFLYYATIMVKCKEKEKYVLSTLGEKIRTNVFVSLQKE